MGIYLQEIYSQFVYTMRYIMARKMIQMDETVYNKLIELQRLYKEKFKKFISLGDLINLIIALPTLAGELKHRDEN
jgi:hypothetical protein